MAADFESRAADWLSFQEALARVLSAAPPLPAIEVPVGESPGLALAQEVLSPLTLPPGPTSHMDGYALRASDLQPGPHGEPPALRVLGRSLPGRPHREPLPPGSAVRIMTGALLPAGADTVVPVEHTDRESGRAGTVRMAGGTDASEALPERGRHVRAAGEEMEAGALLGAPGDSVGFGLLALLAGSGTATVRVHPSPRVALVVTGDELVPAGNLSALDGGIRRADVLSPTLPLLFRSAGATALAPRRAPDDPEALRRTLAAAAAEADLVVTTGGASMGEADLVKGALDALGGTLDFWRIRLRPGSPVSLVRLPVEGRDRPIPVLGLPGNPVSAMVTCLTLALPALRALGGHRARQLRRIRAVAAEPFPGPERLTRLFRVQLDRGDGEERAARSAGPQQSGSFRSLSRADGLALVPEGRPAPAAGDPLDVLLLPEAGWVEGP